MIEAALVHAGRSVVTPAIRSWLTRQQRTADRSLPLVGLINRQVTDAFTRRKVDREIDKLVDSVAERLQPLAARMPDNEVEAALSAVADVSRPSRCPIRTYSPPKSIQSSSHSA